MPTEVQIYRDGTIVGADIANKTITAAQIADKTITAAQIADNTITAAQLAVGAVIPTGGIIMWSGTIANIPTGWALCNGANGTPNLQDRFIVGATSGGDGVYPGVSVGTTGGSANAVVVSHQHTGTTGTESTNHTHGYSYANGGSNGYELEERGSPDGSRLQTYNGTTGTQSANHTHDFTTSTEGSPATNANLPPYYALAFIMKT
jgi:hypothetical protein